MSPSRPFILRPVATSLLMVAILLAGIVAYRLLPLSALPEVDYPTIQVVTLYPGHAAEEVEKQVTIPLEIALSGLPHSLRVFSHTQYGLSSTYITFDDEADNYFAF